MNILKKRKGNIELLRIIAMLFIVFLHLIVKGASSELENNAGSNYYFLWIVRAFCVIGVNCYILISGYFYVENKFHYKKIILMLLQVFFYSVCICIFLKWIGIIDEPAGGWKNVFFPVTSGQYWFVTVYMGLYIISPYLNMFLDYINKEQHLRVVITLTVILSVIPTFLLRESWLNDSGAYSLPWFVFLYILGAYLRNYSAEKVNTIRNVGIYLLITLLMPIIKFLFDYTHNITGRNIVKDTSVFYMFNSLLVLGASVTFFKLFIQIRAKKIVNSKLILWLGNLTFGVYLIHNHRELSKLLWAWVIRDNIMQEWYFPFYAIAIVIIIFLICSVIEYVRKLIFYRLEQSKQLEMVCNTLLKCYNSFLQKIK